MILILWISRLQEDGKCMSQSRLNTDVLDDKLCELLWIEH